MTSTDFSVGPVWLNAKKIAGDGDADALKLAMGLSNAFPWDRLARFLFRDGAVTDTHECRRLLNELARFLLLKVLNDDNDVPPKLSPSPRVDRAWHAMILFPSKYYFMCNVLCNSDHQLIDHDPLGDEAGDRSARREATKQEYERVFGQDPPEEFWGEEEEEEEEEEESDNALKYAEESRALLCSRNPPGSFDISVQTMTAKVLTLRILEDTTMGCVKWLIQKTDGVHIEAQRLIFNGKQLEDHRTASDYNIKKESTLYVVVRLRGC